jgi:hypothetical protein
MSGSAQEVMLVAYKVTDSECKKGTKIALQSERRSGSRALELAIKCRILHRTASRIRMLGVEVTGDRVVIRGRAASYYLKQLALQGVFDVIGRAGATRIELDIDVDGHSKFSEVFQSRFIQGSDR